MSIYTLLVNNLFSVRDASRRCVDAQILLQYTGCRPQDVIRFPARGGGQCIDGAAEPVVATAAALQDFDLRDAAQVEAIVSGACQ